MSKWKQSVDDSVAFYDDGKIPAILVDNKCDLLSPEDEENQQNLKKHSEELGFNGVLGLLLRQEKILLNLCNS